MPLTPVKITISGPHDTGRTTLAVLFEMFLRENGYRDVMRIHIVTEEG